MAIVAAYTSPAFGNLFPILALLIELEQRGHRIVVKTFAGGIDTAGALGFESSAIDPRIEAVQMTDWAAPNGRAALKRAFDVFMRRAEYELDDVRRLVADVEPDVLVVDANCWGAASAADAGSAPWVSFWPYTPFLRSRGIPPFGPGLRPWPGLIGCVRDEALRPLVAGPLMKSLVLPLNAIRRSEGVRPVRDLDDLLRRPPLMLVATGEPFEYPHRDWGDAVVLIGPCEFDRPGAAPQWLADIDRPIVLVTTSSDRQDDSRLPAAAMAAFADDRVHVVATYPCGVPGGLTVPRNATAVGFVPHGAILGRTVCAITHGGMGATQKALARGVPVCAVPHGRDQFEVARRIEYARCGTRLPVRRLTVDRLKKKAVEAMSMTAGAEAVAAGFRATGGVARGADVIESRLLGMSV
ncbi:glycosyl transferase [Mycobacterium sp. Soil538]|nr:glycosyl transferase [Mycobacterium sp. Soil538]